MVAERASGVLRRAERRTAAETCRRFPGLQVLQARSASFRAGERPLGSNSKNMNAVAPTFVPLSMRPCSA